MESTGKKSRGKRGQGCVYRPKNSRNWWVKFSVDGQLYQESAETASKNEAMKCLSRRKNECETGDYVPDIKRVTVKELYDALLADYRINGKSHWWAELNWTKHLEPFFGAMLAKRVGSNTLSRYIESRLEEGAANASINRELSLLQRSFMIGYEAEPKKVSRPLRFHRLEESKPRQGFIEQKQYDALAANCSDLFMRTMLAVAYDFGWRKGELLSLKVSDVDLAEGTIHLRDSKNGEPRTVALTQETRNLLTACIAGKSAEDAVFTRGKGTKAVQDFRGTWDKITLAAGCSGLLFHDLRRSGVRNMVRAGITEHVAMKISGHKTASVFRRYDIVDARDLVDAARKIESSQAIDKLKNSELQQAAKEKQAESVTIH